MYGVYICLHECEHLSDCMHVCICMCMFMCICYIYAHINVCIYVFILCVYLYVRIYLLLLSRVGVLCLRWAGELAHVDVGPDGIFRR